MLIYESCHTCRLYFRVNPLTFSQLTNKINATYVQRSEG